jgi:hypothetical protein
MYSFVLTLHNLLRWLVLILGIVAVVRAFIGWSGTSVWSELDDRLGLGFTISLDLQVLLGLLLYVFLSPITTHAFSNFGAAMADTNTRFFLVEHSFMMVLAIIVAHVGRSRARKQSTDKSKFRATAIFFSIALILVLAAIPWSRPLLPF